MDKLSLPYKCRLPTVSNHQKITNRTPGNSLRSKRSIGRHVAALGGKNEMEVILHQENGVSCKLVRLSGDKNCSKLLVYLPGESHCWNGEDMHGRMGNMHHMQMT